MSRIQIQIPRIGVLYTVKKCSPRPLPDPGMRGEELDDLLTASNGLNPGHLLAYYLLPAEQNRQKKKKKNCRGLSTVLVQLVILLWRSLSMKKWASAL